MAEVITFGEAMVVFIAEETGEFKEVTYFSRGLAGAELNVAVGLTRLGHRTKYITRLGRDPYGEYILDFIRRENIDDSAVFFDCEYLTGSYIKSKVREGDPKIFYYRKNSAASYINAEDIERVDFSGGQILHVSGISAAISESSRRACYRAIEKAREYGMLITFDPNIRRNLWKSEEDMRETLNDLASRCDIILPGLAEGTLLTGRRTPEGVAEFYLNRGMYDAVVKLGAPGAYYKTEKGEQGYVPGFKVEHVVDTVGAGDAFASGFISGILDEISLRESVVRGNAMGAIIITSKSDNDALPTLEELQLFMEREGNFSELEKIQMAQ